MFLKHFKKPQPFFWLQSFVGGFWGQRQEKLNVPILKKSTILFQNLKLLSDSRVSWVKNSTP